MAIKRLQLRGISRTPSDRMNEDGGVAESLNTYIAEAESAPALPPVDKVGDEALGLPSEDTAATKHRAVYIHRIGNEDHYIYIEKDSRGMEKLVAYPGGQVCPPVRGASILGSSVASIGNTLVFSTTAGRGYAIYRNGTYEYLGGEIPQPQIEVYPNIYDGAGEKLNATIRIYPNEEAGQLPNVNPEEAYDHDPMKYELFQAKSDAWNGQLAMDESEREEEFSKITGLFWDKVQESLFDSPYFRCPVFVRFALKLYDGNYVCHTVPIFLGNGGRRAFTATLTYKQTFGIRGQQDVPLYHTDIGIVQDYAFKIMSKIHNASDYDNWRDVIQSIDMFISAPVLYPEMHSEMASCETSVETTLPREGFQRSMEFSFQDTVGSDDEQRDIESSLLEGSRNFFKVRSFPLDNLNELEDGYEQKNSKQLSYLENLAILDTLPDDFRSNNTYSAEKNYIVNRRLLSVGVSETFGRGMQQAYGLMEKPGSSRTYEFIYEIKDNDGILRYVRSIGAITTPRDMDIRQVLFYPDTRCTAVYIINGAGNASRQMMKSHPHLNCAYFIGDISMALSQLEDYESIDLPAEDRVGSSYKDSYLFQSSVENPFFFPVSGRIKFSARIIAAAAISTALSEGQYGQFELYAFTDNGIWVLTPNDDGTYSRINPLSRDVCVSSDSVASIDQAVVFITAKGVMLLSGSKVTNLSPTMTGRHYSMEDSAMSVLMNHEEGNDYAHALTDRTPFMDFMTKDGNTQIAYDYTGGRLIFFNPAFNYEYIYMLGTGTWHKYVMDLQKGDASALDMRILNSYPDCYMFCRDTDGRLHMFNWSTLLDVLDDTTQVTGIIASRPFDLGEPDVLKTINHLRIRGMYDRYDGNNEPKVSYILLGSQDGIKFHRLESLRGKSWKFFRVIIVSRLLPTERISWIDVDYESRFTNKLR